MRMVGDWSAPPVRGGGGDSARAGGVSHAWKFREGRRGRVWTHPLEESVGLRWRGDDVEKWIDFFGWESWSVWAGERGCH